MYKIYCIEDIHGLKYVGCTKQTLKKRLSHHETTRSCSSSKLDLTCCKIYIIEDDIKEENKRAREQYYIEKIDCVNDRNAILDKEKRKEKKKIWTENNKEKLTIQRKQNYQDKKEYYKQYKKQNYQDNKEKILEKRKQLYHYQKSWGGDKRCDNNLLNINVDLFL
tara:strand:- start:308 stop:802 length:495 start_codon:yes stop_codon:yes gene_type:complete